MGDFVLDSNGRCFLCMGLGEGASNSPSKRCTSSPGKRDQMSASEAYSLRCLSRYLGIGRSGDRSKIIFLCGRCAPICYTFSELYQQRELIDMKMTSYLKLIHGELAEDLRITKNCRRSGALLLSADVVPGEIDDIMQGLRKELFQACSQKIIAIPPRVNVRRMTLEEVTEQTLGLNRTSIEDEASPDGSIIKFEVPYHEHDDFEDPSIPLDSEVTKNASESQQDLNTSTVKKRGRPSKNKRTAKKSSRKKKRKPGSGKPRTTPWSLNPETGQYTCTLCSEDFPSYFKFYKHHDVFHNKIKYKCDICSKEFPYKIGYQSHLKRVHTDVGSTYKCEKCSAIFTQAGNLYTHQRNVNCTDKDYPTWKTRYDVGGKHQKEIQQRRQPQLNDDWKLQSSVDPETGRVTCLHCPKDFQSLKTFRDHYSAVHLKLKYKCGLCPKEFSYKSKHHQHMIEAHKRGSFRCPKCDKFFTRIGLAQHQRWSAVLGRCGRRRVPVSMQSVVEVKVEPNMVSDAHDGTGEDCCDDGTGSTTGFAVGLKTEGQENASMDQSPTKDRSPKLTQKQESSTTEESVMRFKRKSTRSQRQPSTVDRELILDNDDNNGPMEDYYDDCDNADATQRESYEDKDEGDVSATKKAICLNERAHQKSHLQDVPRTSGRTKRKSTTISPVDDDMFQEDENVSMDDYDGISDDSYHPPASPQKSDEESKLETTTDLPVKKQKRNHREPKADKLQETEGEGQAQYSGVKVAPSRSYKRNRRMMYIEESHRIKNPETGKVRCALCPNMGEVTQASFRAHYRFTHLNHRFTCTLCGNSFRSRTVLLTHVDRMHKAPEFNDSEVLPLQFTRKRFIGDAFLIKNPETKKVRCALCPNGRDYPQSDAFREHYKKVHLNHRYKCTLCDKSFLYRGTLRIHFDRVHKAEGNFPCEKCGKVYSVKHDLTQHLTLSQTCGKRDRPTWLCNTCGKIFKSKKTLNHHVRTIHQSLNLKNEPGAMKKKFQPEFQGPTTNLIPDQETGTFKLEVVGESVEVDVVEPINLNERVKGEVVVIASAAADPDVGTYSYQELYPPNVPQGAAPPEPVVDQETGKFKCNDCPMEFEAAINYRNHYKGIHWNVKYQCNLCKQEFTQVASCHRHHRTKHLNVRVKCPVCQGLFTDNAGLKKHLKRTSCGKGRKPKPKREPDQFCHICGVGLRGVQSLRWHVKYTHSNVRGHLCDICGKGFKATDQLKRHRDAMHPGHSKGGADDQGGAVGGQ